MNTRLKSRIGNIELKRNIGVHSLDKSAYAIVALIALWASAVLDKWSTQLLALAVMLGLKWIFETQKSVIQIFMQEKGGDKDGSGCEIV